MYRLQSAKLVYGLQAALPSLQAWQTSEFGRILAETPILSQSVFSIGIDCTRGCWNRALDQGQTSHFLTGKVRINLTNGGCGMEPDVGSENTVLQRSA